MTPAARIAAAIEILDAFLGGAAAEQALTAWARRSRFAGSKDRAAVRDHVFDAIRRLRSDAARGGAATGRGLMLGALRRQGADPEAMFTGEGHAPTPLTPEERLVPEPAADRGTRLDLPDWLLPLLDASLGAEGTEAAGLALQDRAPVFLRANLRKAAPDQVVEALRSSGIACRPHPLSPTAIEVTEGARALNVHPVLSTGLAELQDAASQAVTDSLPLTDGMRVLDYCAGGGGKTLAMAGRARAEFTCHDADPRRMKDLPSRADRAGVAVRIVADADLWAQDLVLCDVPCSGSGAWRRSPEGKWRLTPEALARLTTTQDAILDRASALTAPAGVLAYATCSLLRAENEDRVAAFLARHPGWICAFQRRIGLEEGGDGFHVAHLTRVGAGS